MGQTSDIGSQQQAQAAAQTAQLNSAVGKIGSAFKGFTPQFYDNYQNQILQSTGPQLGQQARSQGQQLDYSLADKGLTNSGTANALKTSLGQNVATQETGLVNQAQTAAQQLQQQVQGQENTLIGEAETASNPGAVASQALNTASQFQSPSLVAPVGNLLSNWANTYMTGQYASALTPYLTALSTQPLIYGQGAGLGATKDYQ